MTVRSLGTFLTDPLDVPMSVLDFVAEQLGIADPSCVKAYMGAAEHTLQARGRDWPRARLLRVLVVEPELLEADNLDIGRPEQVELISAGRRVRPGHALATPEIFKTKVVTRGVDVTVNAFYRHSRIKQYLKDGRALRVETVINDPYDLGCQRRLHNLPELQTKAHAVNRLLDTERVGQSCVLANPAFERIAHPTTSVDGRRAPARRFGDPRVQALPGALATTLHVVTGITNKSLRALMTGLLGEPHSMNRASYDLTRYAATASSFAFPAPTATSSPTTASPSPSSTPKSTTASSGRCWPPPHHKPRHRYALRCAPSTNTSTLASPPHGYRQQPPDTLTKCQSPSDQGSLADPLRSSGTGLGGRVCGAEKGSAKAVAQQ